MHITCITSSTSCLKDNINNINNNKSPCKYVPYDIACGAHGNKICEKPLDFQGISFIYNPIIWLVSGGSHSPFEIPWKNSLEFNRRAYTFCTWTWACSWFNQIQIDFKLIWNCSWELREREREEKEIVPNYCRSPKWNAKEFQLRSN